jgi:hypothetical protein
MAKESIMERRVQLKKNSRVSPCFYIRNFLKQPLWALQSSCRIVINVVVVVIVVVIVVVNLRSKEKWMMYKGVVSHGSKR